MPTREAHRHNNKSPSKGNRFLLLPGPLFGVSETLLLLRIPTTAATCNKFSHTCTSKWTLRVHLATSNLQNLITSCCTLQGSQQRQLFGVVENTLGPFSIFPRSFLIYDKAIQHVNYVTMVWLDTRSWHGLDDSILWVPCSCGVLEPPVQ